MAVIATLAWGLVGFFLICLMQLVSMLGFGKESLHKHGIAEIQASRLGGAATILGGVLLLFLLAPMGVIGAGEGPLNIDWFAWIAVGSCVALHCRREESETATRSGTEPTPTKAAPKPPPPPPSPSVFPTWNPETAYFVVRHGAPLAMVTAGLEGMARAVSEAGFARLSSEEGARRTHAVCAAMNALMFVMWFGTFAWVSGPQRTMPATMAEFRWAMRVSIPVVTCVCSMPAFLLDVADPSMIPSIAYLYVNPISTGIFISGTPRK